MLVELHCAGGVWVGKRGLVEADVEGEGDLEEEDEGYADIELGMVGFVAEYTHGGPCAYAAAEDGEEEECGLGGAPGFGLGLALVAVVGYEGRDVDDEEVDEEDAK